MATHRTDSDIKKDILDELKWDPEVLETDIGVTVKNGAVTLNGVVSTYLQKLAAKNAAKRIKGVHAVADEIELKYMIETKGSDQEIAERIASIFEWNTQIPGDDIKAEVRKGLVTLSGSVDWQYQRNYAETLIAPLTGVKSIMNNIKIRTRASAFDVKKDIVKALHRHASVESDRINVSVTGGTVTLTGNVDSYLEKDLSRTRRGPRRASQKSSTILLFRQDTASLPKFMPASHELAGILFKRVHYEAHISRRGKNGYRLALSDRNGIQ